MAACGSVAEPQSTPDAAPDAATPDAGVDAAMPCTGGDAQVVDPESGACYFVVRAVRIGAEARVACAALGGQLATVRTSAQNTLITNLVGASEALIGANDVLTEGDFRWADGAPLTYSNWRANEPPTPNEPNNGAGLRQEDCVVLVGATAGVWDDKPCDETESATPEKYQFVCERR